MEAQDFLNGVYYEGKFKYFRPIKEVLCLNEETPEWFRNTGPVAVDFKNGYVLERKTLLDELNTLMLNNKISILEGNAGTGKSVLIRNYAFNAIEKERNKRIYYYSFKEDLAIDSFPDFLSILSNIDGLVIIEDVHLATQEMQNIVDRLYYKNDCHILLTAHRSFRDNLLEGRPKTLNELHCLRLNSENNSIYTEDTGKLIDLYAEKQCLQWTDEIKHAIRKVSNGDFWLLSYALKGCTGEGNPISWIKDGVMQDLQDVENNRVYKCKSEILLALSPLYMSEVLTAQPFLVKELGYERKEIDKLITIGKVIKHKIDGEIFYGLSHSSIAMVYWRYGDEYRKCLKYSDYEDFIYNYAISGVSNGLTASIKTDKKTRNWLFNQLVSKGKMFEIIEKEKYKNINDTTKYVDAIFSLVETNNIHLLSLKLADLFLERKCYIVLSILLCGKNMQGSEILNAAEYWQRMGQADKYSLVNAFFDDIYPSPIIACIEVFIYKNNLVKSEIIHHLIDCNYLATRANQCNWLPIVFKVVTYLGKLDNRLERDICDLMDASILEAKLGESKYSAFFKLSFVLWLCDIKSKVGDRLKYMIELGIPTYIMGLMGTDYYSDYTVQDVYFDDLIYRADPVVATKLYDYICKHIGLDDYIKKINISYGAEYCGQNKYLMDAKDSFGRRAYDYFSKVDPQDTQGWKQFFTSI
jgi:hypothetical protein